MRLVRDLGAEHHAEPGGVRERELHVAQTERTEPGAHVARARLRRDEVGDERAVAVLRDRREERRLIGEMPVRRVVADPDHARRLAQRERRRAVLLDDRDGRVDERAPQVAVVVALLLPRGSGARLVHETLSMMPDSERV